MNAKVFKKLKSAASQQICIAKSFKIMLKYCVVA